MLDTDVIVAGLRSPTGASAGLLRAARLGRFRLLLTVALAFEYRAVCLLPEQRLASGLDEGQVMTALTGLFALAEPVDVHYRWRPQLHDPGDEMVLETAINGRADALVTFNRRDFTGVPERFGIELLGPGEALARIRS